MASKYHLFCGAFVLLAFAFICKVCFGSRSHSANHTGDGADPNPTGSEDSTLKEGEWWQPGKHAASPTENKLLEEKAQKPPTPLKRSQLGKPPMRVAVIGSSTKKIPELTWPLAEVLAQSGCDLVTSGLGGSNDEVRHAFKSHAEGKTADSLWNPPDHWDGDYNVLLDRPADTDDLIAPQMSPGAHILRADLVLGLPGGSDVTGELKFAMENDKRVIAIISGANTADDAEVAKVDGRENTYTIDSSQKFQEVSKFLEDLRGDTVGTVALP